MMNSMTQDQARQKWENAVDLANALGALAHRLQEHANRAETREEWLYRQGQASQAAEDAAEAKANERIAWVELQAAVEADLPTN